MSEPGLLGCVRILDLIPKTLISINPDSYRDPFRQLLSNEQNPDPDSYRESVARDDDQGSKVGNINSITSEGVLRTIFSNR